jgi:HD-like signal output (HDOD) protein/ActR/RegA family two-component response regulator
MSRVMVVDDMAIFREPIAECLRHAGFETECAGNGRDALVAMCKSPPDVLLLDLAMPQVDGLKVLRAMRGEPRLAGVPVILLTAVSDRPCVVEAARLGVRDYMLKSRFSVDELVTRIRRRLADAAGPATGGGAAGAPPAGGGTPAAAAAAAAPVPAPRPATVVDPDYKPPRLLTREESLERAERAFDMKTMPGVVMEVIARAASPRTDSADLAALIGRDSMLAAKVLQAANSAAYASSRGMVATLPEAVRNIGCGTVRNVAASLGIFEVMPPQTDESFNPVRCWQHSLAVAVLCERLAGLSDLCPPNVAYLVGLCHDLGEILFRTAFAAEYRQVMEAQERSGMRRDAVERLMLGVSHNEVVNLILGKLGLPDSIRRPIEAMGSPSQRSTDPAARILTMANAYANGLSLCESKLARVSPVTRADCRAATGQDEPPVPDGAGFAGEIVALTALLARLSAAQERELTRPLLARSAGARVWLARDRAFSSYDPIAAALGQVAAEVRAENRLPTAAEAQDVDRVVVVGRTTSAAGVGLPEVQKLLSAGVTAGRVMWLAGKEDLPVPDAMGVRPVVYPVSLRDLEAFVGGAETVERAAA